MTFVTESVFVLGPKNRGEAFPPELLIALEDIIRKSLS